jgi:phage tail sheath protein FI
VQSALITHCETLTDRFTILDSPPGASVQDVQAFRSPIDTKYAALYYPWVEIRDPRPGGDSLVAPPAGFLAGIYARTDIGRGVFKAPANEVIRSIRGFELSITKREQDVLNPQNINVLRFFPGRGNRVWGARVLTSDAAWKYVPVRRLFIMIEESIDEATQWVVFEPNDERLWARVRQSVERFLVTQWRLGALFGATEAEAFFVVCDRSTMSQDEIDNGQLICEIGIAPVKPAEFVIFRIQQKTLANVTA